MQSVTRLILVVAIAWAVSDLSAADQTVTESKIRVLVVTGPDGDRIIEALAGRRVHFVTNPDAESEMLSSVRCGLTALPEDCVAVLVV